MGTVRLESVEGFSMVRLLVHILAIAVAVGSCVAAADSINREEWVGRGQLGSTPLFVQIMIDTDAETIRVHVPHLLVFDGTPENIREEDRLTFDLQVRGAVLELSIKRGDLDATRGTAIARFVSGPESATALEPVTFALALRPNLAMLSVAERFSGNLQIPNGGSLGFSLVLADVEGELFGAIDIPAQGIRGLALECTMDGDDYILGLPVPSPASMTLTRNGDTLEGTFRQGPMTLPIAFEKGEMEVVVVRSPRPQEPTQPFPYDVADLHIATRAGHELAGTLSMPRIRPADGAPFVVLVSGSGAQNRDEELMNHKPFLVLADRLARAGIASFRYDDRGVYESQGDFALATTPDFAHDAMSMLEHFRSDPRIDPARSGIMGHSEGGIVAAIAGSGQAPGFEGTPPPAFIVMLAGTGVSGADVLKEQMRQLLRAEGVEAEAIAAISLAQCAVINGIVDGLSEDVLRERVAELTARQLEMNGMLESTSHVARDLGVNQAIAQLMSPWMNAFIRYDPGVALRACNLPVLAINGTLDRQVWHDQNLPAIEEAVTAAGGDVTILRVPGLNHLLQPATTGAVSEYESIETTIDEGVLTHIIEWINQR